MNKIEKINTRLAWARHHRDQLAGIAVDLAELLEVKPASQDGRDLHSVVHGEIDFDEAMRRIMNRKLCQYSAMAVEASQE
jgi:hypothetical protein